MNLIAVWKREPRGREVSVGPKDEPKTTRWEGGACLMAERAAEWTVPREPLDVRAVREVGIQISPRVGTGGRGRMVFLPQAWELMRK